MIFKYEIYVLVSGKLPPRKFRPGILLRKKKFSDCVIDPRRRKNVSTQSAESIKLNNHYIFAIR